MTKKVKLDDIKVNHIVKGFAKQFSLEVDEEKNETCVRVPEELGSGYMKSVEFENGIGIVETDYILKEPMQYQLEKGVVHPLKFIFNREGTFKHKFENTNEINEVKRLESLIVCSELTDTHEFFMPANEAVCIFSLEINRKIFETHIADFLADMNEELVSLFRDVNGVNQFCYKAQYSLEISQIISEIVDCDLEGFMRNVFLESKSKEILVLILQQYIDDLNEPDKRKILRQATIKSVKEASKIIEREITSMDSVSKLAKRVGLSANTLQQGFKSLYKVSVNDYIRNFRIEKAKELIETTDNNITEITYQIGINSRSYFSKLFKERYGISPKQYYDKIRRKDTNDTKSA